MADKEKLTILLAEDQENDLLLIKRAFEKGGVVNPVFVVRDGEEALAYLSGSGKFSNREEFPLPDLFLLDLKMPKIDGFEVLKWIRQQPGFSNLLVVVLTTSNDVYDVNRAYQSGANSFLVKPQDFENYVQTCKTLRDYWLNMNRLPDSSRLSRRKGINLLL